MKINLQIKQNCVGSEGFAYGRHFYSQNMGHFGKTKIKVKNCILYNAVAFYRKWSICLYVL